MVTKRAMATNGDNMGNRYGKDDGDNGSWFGVVYVLVCVERQQKIRNRAKLSMIPRALRKPPLSECVIF
jgi:hypothetical protein